MISIYVAVSENGVIGRENSLPWQMSSDLKKLSQTTKGHTVIMGRKTFESIVERIGKPLPERRSIVITRQKDYVAPEGVLIVNSIEDALKLVDDEEENFIFGGAEIYKLAMPYADKIYLTRVHTEIEGDAYFPEISNSDWDLKSEEKHQKDEKNEFDYSFLVYERRK